MQMTHQGFAWRHIAAVLRRAPSSISREIRRNTIAVANVPYDAAAAGRQAGQRISASLDALASCKPTGSLHRRHRPAASRLVATTDSRQTA